MTRNSKRRAAEQAVIDAAEQVIGFWDNMHLVQRDGFNGYPQYMALRDAVEALRALGMELPGEARSSTRHPVTSDQAAAWMHGARATSAAARIVRHLYVFPVSGRTVDELIDMLAMPHQTCSPRVNELRNDGWIVDSGRKRETRSGQEAIVWVLSVRAREYLREAERAP